MEKSREKKKKKEIEKQTKKEIGEQEVLSDKDDIEAGERT